MRRKVEKWGEMWRSSWPIEIEAAEAEAEAAEAVGPLQ